MSIQSDINQTIGMTSALLSINPSFQEAAKKRSELKSIDEQLSDNIKLQKTVEIAGGATSGLQNKLEANRRDLLEKKFRLKPTAETYDELKKATPITFDAEPEEMARERAEYDYRYSTAYDEAYAEFANNRAVKARETISKLKNDYYFGGKRINDVLGQQSVELLAKREKENEQK